MFTIVEAGTNPMFDNHPVYVVYREDGSYWGLTQTTALDVLVDGLAQEMGGRYQPARCDRKPTPAWTAAFAQARRQRWTDTQSRDYADRCAIDDAADALADATHQAAKDRASEPHRWPSEGV